MSIRQQQRSYNTVACCVRWTVTLRSHLAKALWMSCWHSLEMRCMDSTRCGSVISISDGQIQIMIWFKSWFNHVWWFDLIWLQENLIWKYVIWFEFGLSLSWFDLNKSQVSVIWTSRRRTPFSTTFGDSHRSMGKLNRVPKKLADNRSCSRTVWFSDCFWLNLVANKQNF